ncbi:MAG: hypothetical protein FWD67_09870 [Betaproteobacteria bacterium]|nr:hypothetical protein [Betaproteobacteria bacterium]
MVKPNFAKNRNIGEMGRSMTINDFWANCLPATDSHSFLKKYAISPRGMRTTKGGILVIPTYNVDGEMLGIHFLDYEQATGKTITSRLCYEWQGAYFSFGSPKRDVIFVEANFLKAALLHTRYGETVAACFYPGNVDNVVDALREKYPNNFIAPLGWKKQ